MTKALTVVNRGRREAEGTGQGQDSRICAISWWQKHSYKKLHTLMLEPLASLRNNRGYLESDLVPFVTSRWSGSTFLLCNNHDEYILDLISPQVSSVQS